MQLYAAIGQTLRTLAPRAYAARPELLANATGDAAGLGLRERRALRKQAQSLLSGSAQLSREQLSASLNEAAGQLAQWQELRTDDGLPRLPAGFGELESLSTECERQLSALRAYVRIPDEPEPLLAALAADQDTAWKLPRLYQLGIRFDDIGLGPLLDELARREADPDMAVAAFDHAWYSAVLDQIRSAIPAMRPTAVMHSTRSPATSGCVTCSTWRQTRLGCAAPGPTGCAMRRTGIRCRPG